jgi:thiamine-phosphate pyrophosphorylase
VNGSREHRPHLYLATPAGLLSDGPALEKFEAELQSALDAGEVACVLLSTGGTDDDAAVGPVANRLAPLVQGRDIAFLIEGLVQAAQAAQADGVQIAWDRDGYISARKSLGEEAIVGVHCGGSRHDAMLAAEVGADYVAFDAAEHELVAWWVSLMQIPAVAFGAGTGDIVPLKQAGADFIAVREAVWNHPQGSAAAVRSLDQALDRAPGQAPGQA